MNVVFRFHSAPICEYVHRDRTLRIGGTMFKQAQIVVVTIAALTPLLVAVTLAATIPSATQSQRAVDTEHTWNDGRLASNQSKAHHKF